MHRAIRGKLAFMISEKPLRCRIEQGTRKARPTTAYQPLSAIIEIVQKGLATVNALTCGCAVYPNVHKAFSGKCVSICSEVHALILGNAIAFPKVKRAIAG